MDKRNGNVKVTNKGIGFGGVLTIVFIVLKLLGKISWSWVWVFSPLWISSTLSLLILLVSLIIIGIAKKIINEVNQ